MDTALQTNKPARLFEKTIGGLHEAVFGVFTQYIKTPSRVLDLGACTGAWAARLMTFGHDVTCVDQDMDSFALESIDCVQADLNDDFSTAIPGTYSAVTAIEVIEHLENPRHFLKQCNLLLKREGILLLTTPNIESAAGRLRFLLTGNFRMFDRDERLNDPTHISPIQTFMFEKMVKDAGFVILIHTTSAARVEISTPLSRLICSLLNRFLARNKRGDNHIFVLSKT
jgi:2-polyprenyl-3-methyl-5-hydroxy-6-metoxy-1,4-benzoquinol methylase